MKTSDVINNWAQESLPEQDDLPNELWMEVLSYLGHSDLQQVRLVSRRWSELSHLPQFLAKSKLIVRKGNVGCIRQCLERDEGATERLSYQTMELCDLATSDDLKYVLKRLGRRVRRLTLQRSPVFGALIGHVPQLEELTVSDVSAVDVEDISAIRLSHFEHLKALDMSSTSVARLIKTHLLVSLTRADNRLLRLEQLHVEVGREQEDLLLFTLEGHANSMRRLSISLSTTPTLYTRWRRLFEKLSQLEALKLMGNCRHDWLLTVLHALPADAPLTHFDLSGLVQLDDNLLRLIVMKWPGSVQHLELIFCNRITDEGVRQLGALRKSLRTLNLSFCSKVTGRGLLEGVAAQCNRSLSGLSVSDLPELDEPSLCLLAERLPNLTHLCLENCRNAVTDVVLAHIFQHQTRLQHLVLDDCIHISDEGLLGFGLHPAPIRNLRGLQSLSLRGCRNLSNCSLLCGLRFAELRQLKLGYCHQISAVGIEELVRQCPALEDLVISSCRMIDDDAVLHIASGLRRLRKLNLSNCFSLTGRSVDHIVERCKSLRELIMCGIDSLEVQCVQQRFLDVKPLMLELSL